MSGRTLPVLNAPLRKTVRRAALLSLLALPTLALVARSVARAQSGPAVEGSAAAADNSVIVWRIACLSSARR